MALLKQPVHQWLFNEATPASGGALDSNTTTPIDLDAVTGTPTSAAGKFNNSIAVDENNFVKASSGSIGLVKQTGPGFSMSVWMKANAAVNGLNLNTIGFFDSSTVTDYFDIYFGYTAGAIGCYVASTYTTDNGTLGSAILYRDAPGLEWINIILVADYEEDEVRMYVNGALSYQNSLDGEKIAAPTDELAVGEFNYSFGGGADGWLVDQLLWFDVPLDGDDVYQIYKNTSIEDLYSSNIGSQALSLSPSAHWKMEDGTPGDSVLDSIGTLHLDTQSGASITSVPGKFGNAVDMPGTVGDAPYWAGVSKTIIPADGYFSIELWVNIDVIKSISFNGGDYPSTLIGAGGTAGYLFLNLYKNADSNNEIHISYVINDGTSEFSVFKHISDQISTSNWHHICVTYNNTSPQIYIDSVQMNTGDDGDRIRRTGDSGSPGDMSQFLIFRPATGQSGEEEAYTDGRADNVRIFNKTLTPADARALYNQGYGVEDTAAAEKSDNNGAGQVVGIELRNLKNNVNKYYLGEKFTYIRNGASGKAGFSKSGQIAKVADVYYENMAGSGQAYIRVGNATRDEYFRLLGEDPSKIYRVAGTVEVKTAMYARKSNGAISTAPISRIKLLPVELVTDSIALPLALPIV